MASHISIHKSNTEIIWQQAAEFLVNWLRVYRNIGQKTLLLLSAGSVVRLYERLTRKIREDKVNWGFLAIAQVDERFQPENKEDINAYQIEKTGLFDICKKKNIPYYLVPQEGTLREAADNYNETIADLFEHFTYKIGVLGIGEDSHTAGFLPGYEKVWNVNSQVVGYECKGLFKQRITITPKPLLQLDQAIVVAAGEKKKEAIKHALNTSNMDKSDKYPAAILQKMKKVDLFTDITY